MAMEVTGTYSMPACRALIEHGDFEKQPRDELPDVLQPGLASVQAPEPGEVPEVLQAIGSCRTPGYAALPLMVLVRVVSRGRALIKTPPGAIHGAVPGVLTM